MSYSTKSALTNQVDAWIIETIQALHDSPNSRMAAVHSHIGFYEGYSQAMNWDTDLSSVIKWHKMAANGK